MSLPSPSLKRRSDQGGDVKHSCGSARGERFIHRRVRARALLRMANDIEVDLRLRAPGRLEFLASMEQWGGISNSM